MQTKKNDTTELEAFYNQVQEFTELYKKKASILIVAGDFNSKLGQRTEEDHDIMGKHVHTKARRNTHGQYLRN